MISEDDPVVSLALCGIRPALISAQTGVPPSAVSVRLTAARKAGFAIPDFTGYRSEKLSADEVARIARKAEVRETTFADRVRAFDPHPGTAAASVISDQVGDTLTPGPCAWCGGRILEGTRIRRLEREIDGRREVSRFCTACIVVMAGAQNDGGDIEERRKLRSPP